MNKDDAVKHELQSPFPVRPTKRDVIVNERCACGHLRSDHHDTVAYGHGSCGRTKDGCKCQNFSWKRFVLL